MSLYTPGGWLRDPAGRSLRSGLASDALLRRPQCSILPQVHPRLVIVYPPADTLCCENSAHPALCGVHARLVFFFPPPRPVQLAAGNAAGKGPVAVSFFFPTRFRLSAADLQGGPVHGDGTICRMATFSLSLSNTTQVSRAVDALQAVPVRSRTAAHPGQHGTKQSIKVTSCPILKAPVSHWCLAEALGEGGRQKGKRNRDDGRLRSRRLLSRDASSLASISRFPFPAPLPARQLSAAPAFLGAHGTFCIINARPAQGSPLGHQPPRNKTNAIHLVYTEYSADCIPRSLSLSLSLSLSTSSASGPARTLALRHRQA